jgi:SAM-dependent methyltransferase
VTQIPAVGPDQAQQQRYERERTFHDERFGSDEGRAADRFYVVNRFAEQDYHRCVLSVAPGTRALEYGCGTASVAFTLAERGIESLGIDISPVAVARATDVADERGLTSVSFAVMNAEHLELPDRSVGLVFGSGILHHLDLDRAAAEVARVLRDDGRAVFLEPLGHNPLINLYRRFTPGMRTTDEHPLRRADIRDLKVRFARVTCRSYVLLAMAAFPLRRFRCLPAVLARLTTFDAMLFRRFPRLADHAWMVVIEVEAPRR